jgi:Spy/CpxP family protein refolding chaperone
MAKLNLTATQRNQAQAIRKTAQERVANVRSDNTLTQAQKRDKVASIMRVAHNDFLEILTPAQRTELQNCQRTGQGMHKSRSRS